MTKKQMLMQAIVFCLAWCALPFLLACDRGCEEHSGVCACDAKPEQAPVVNLASDEKPRREQQPEWQTGEVVAAMPPSEASKDAKLDQDKAEADQQGKKAAGL